MNSSQNKCVICWKSHRVAVYDCNGECVECDKNHTGHECIYCGQNDHDCYDCQKSKCNICRRRHKTENHECLICKKKDHAYFECLERCNLCLRAHKSEDHACKICNDPNHNYRQCPEECTLCCKNSSFYMDRDHKTQDHICELCGEKGHDHEKCSVISMVPDVSPEMTKFEPMGFSIWRPHVRYIMAPTEPRLTLMRGHSEDIEKSNK